MSKIKVDLNDLDKYFVKSELIPAICYEVNTKTVLMLAYMNKESLKKTLDRLYLVLEQVTSGILEQRRDQRSSSESCINLR